VTKKTAIRRDASQIKKYMRLFENEKSVGKKFIYAIQVMLLWNQIQVIRATPEVPKGE
jgi:hypothetical protein